MRKGGKDWLIIVVIGIIIFYMTGFGIKSPTTPNSGDNTSSNKDYVEVKIKDTTIRVNDSEVTVSNLLDKVASYNKTKVHLIDDLASNNTYTTVYNMLEEHYSIVEKTTY